MAEYRTLDEFEPGETSEDEPSPPAPTYRWEPSGSTCSGCGDTVTSLWIGDHGLICASCKDW